MGFKNQTTDAKTIVQINLEISIEGLSYWDGFDELDPVIVQECLDEEARDWVLQKIGLGRNTVEDLCDAITDYTDINIVEVKSDDSNN